MNGAKLADHNQQNGNMIIRVVLKKKKNIKNNISKSNISTQGQVLQPSNIQKSLHGKQQVDTNHFGNVKQRANSHNDSFIMKQESNSNGSSGTMNNVVVQNHSYMYHSTPSNSLNYNTESMSDRNRRNINALNRSPSFSNGSYSMNTDVGRETMIGVYTKKERVEKIKRYRSKRNFKPRVIYQCRKRLADERPRHKGKFVVAKKKNKNKK